MYYFCIMPSQQSGLGSMTVLRDLIRQPPEFSPNVRTAIAPGRQDPATPAAPGLPNDPGSTKKPQTRLKVGSSNPTSPLGHTGRPSDEGVLGHTKPLPPSHPVISTPHPRSESTRASTKQERRGGKSRNTTPPRARLLWVAGGFSELVQPLQSIVSIV